MDWNKYIYKQKLQPYFRQLVNFIIRQQKITTVYPKYSDVFRCFNYFNIQETKVVIIGQDPYQTPNYANGLAFAVNHNVTIPKSLVNIFLELKNDIGVVHTDRTLLHWAKQGVLLLNIVLTVNARSSNSHAGHGWEIFSTSIVKMLNEKLHNIVFILWGKKAQKMAHIINSDNHLIIASAHPSPLSAHNGFFGSKPFSRTNAYLIKHNKKPIDW